MSMCVRPNYSKASSCFWCTTGKAFSIFLSKLRRKFTSWLFYKQNLKLKSELTNENHSLKQTSIAIRHLIKWLKALFLRRHVGFSYPHPLTLMEPRRYNHSLNMWPLSIYFHNPICKTQLLNDLPSPFPAF